MIGSRFNKWVVLSEQPKPKQNCKHYLCRCDCGNEVVVIGTSLRLGMSTMCRDCAFKRHGMSKTGIYKIWAGILTRCQNPRVKIYKYYGGRGIKVCDRWLKFENFFADMGHRPGNKEVDRIDNDGHYEPGNCRWATRAENHPGMNGTLKDDMPGKVFGKWTVKTRVKHKPGHRYYECQCACGTISIKSGGDLRSGGTTQCINCKHISHRGWPNRIKSGCLS